MIQSLNKRSQFLKVARGHRWSSPFFILQFRKQHEMPLKKARFGFTVTKKIGNAVVRNKVRRRLKEALLRVLKEERSISPDLGGYDYVLVAKNKTPKAPFDHLVATLAQGLKAGIKNKVRKPEKIRETVSSGKQARKANQTYQNKPPEDRK